jgi:predicted transcriptional regulator
MDEQAVTFRLPKELHRRLRRVAFDLEVSMNAITVRAIENILGDKEALADLEADKGSAPGT